MKKLLLSLIILLSLTACGNIKQSNEEVKPEEILKIAISKLNESSDIDANSSIESSFKIGDLKQNQTINMHIKGTKINSINEAQMIVDTEIIGSPLKTMTYIKDGYIYMDLVDNKFKTKLEEIDDIKEYTDQIILNEYNPDIFKNIKFDDNNKNIITFEIDTNGVFGIENDIDDDIDEKDIKSNNAKAYIEIDDDNNIIKANINLEIKIDKLDQDIIINTNSTIIYNQTNNILLEFPDDLDNYSLIED